MTSERRQPLARTPLIVSHEMIGRMLQRHLLDLALSPGASAVPSVTPEVGRALAPGTW